MMPHLCHRYMDLRPLRAEDAMRRLLAALLAALLLGGCATTPGTRALGDSSGSTRTCTDIITETTTAPDGTVTVVETCEGLIEEASVGGPGSVKLYEFLGAALGVASIVMQALR